MLRLRVAQYPTDAVSDMGKMVKNALCCFCKAADAVRTCPRPPAFHDAHAKSAAPPPSSRGSDQVSRYLIPSTPPASMYTGIPKQRKSARQMWQSPPAPYFV